MRIEQQDRSLMPITFLVIALHAVMLTMAYIDSSLSKPVAPPIAKRLVVQTVALQPQVQEEEPFIAVQEEPPPKEEPAPPPPQEVEIPKEEPPPPPPPAPVVEQEIKKPKPVEKKPTPPPKKKTPPKPVKKKEVAKPKKTETKTKPKVTPAKNIPKVDPKVEAAKAKKRTLLEQAQKSIAKIEKNSDKISANRASTIAEANVPARIESLHVEALVGDGTQTFTKQEIGYNDELAGRLKLMLRLPEFGDVKVKLTLERSGKFVKAVIVSAESTANKKYVEKNLPKLSYPGFGNNFGTEPQYTFVIVLSNDL